MSTPDRLTWFGEDVTTAGTGSRWGGNVIDLNNERWILAYQDPVWLNIKITELVRTSNQTYVMELFDSDMLDTAGTGLNTDFNDDGNVLSQNLGTTAVATTGKPLLFYRLIGDSRTGNLKTNELNIQRYLRMRVTATGSSPSVTWTAYVARDRIESGRRIQNAQTADGWQTGREIQTALGYQWGAEGTAWRSSS